MAKVQPSSQPPWRFHEPSSSASRMQLLSRISANLPTYSPIVFRFLNGHPSLKPGQFAAIPFVSSTRDLYGHTPLPKAEHFLTISSTVKEYGHRRFKCKVKLETKIFTGNCTQQLKEISRELITFFFTSGNRFFRMIHVSRFALKVGKTPDSDNRLALIKKLGKENKFPHLSYTLESSLSMVFILQFHSETEITYHSVCRFQNLLSCNVFSKGAATLEGALRGYSSIFYVFFLSKKVDILQKLDPLSFTFGLVTHLTHHVLKLTHSLALFEGAAIVERRTFGTDAFLFLGKLGIWAATTEKCWAVLRYVIHGDV